MIPGRKGDDATGPPYLRGREHAPYDARTQGVSAVRSSFDTPRPGLAISLRGHIWERASLLAPLRIFHRDINRDGRRAPHTASDLCLSCSSRRTFLTSLSIRFISRQSS